MASEDDLSRDALFYRADKAIADAVALCAEGRAKLEAARHRPPFGLAVGGVLPTVPPPGLLPRFDALKPWLLAAHALSAADQVIGAADPELERQWCRVLPTIQTPRDFLR